MEAGKTKVRVINEYGTKCAVGTYCGQGIPGGGIVVAYPHLQHYAVLVGTEMRYYPTGFHTLQSARDDE